MDLVTLKPIGLVRSSRNIAEDDHWDAVVTTIELDSSQFGPEALLALDSFSHLQVVFLMDRVEVSKIESGARHPRNNLHWPKVGIFAQRAKNRPNRIGETICRIDRIDGLTIHVTGLDAIEGSPVLDLKPWVRQFGPRGEVHQPAWMDELMNEYWE